MKHQFTQTDLIRNLYQESSYLEKMGIQQAVKQNESLEQAQEELQAAKALLDSVELEPPAFTVQNILNYSKRSTLEAEAG